MNVQEQADAYATASALWGQGPVELAMIAETGRLEWPSEPLDERMMAGYYGDQGHHVRWRNDGTMVHSYRSVE
jgi:hypothetical protein